LKIETHKEAIKLQSKLDNIVSNVLGEKDTELSMALTGRLKVSIDSNFICFNRDYKTVEYIRYIGDYNVLVDYINTLATVFAKYKDDFDALMDSYDNISKLK